LKSVISDKNICAVTEKVLSAAAAFQAGNQRRLLIPAVFIIVPDRGSLAAEKFLALRADCLLNVRVVTFSMLFRILSGGQAAVLDKTSAVLFMWRAIQDVRADLCYFSRSASQYAFAEKMFNTINQLKSSLADFLTLEKNAISAVTKRKMRDIAAICARYQELLSGEIDGSGILDWLINNVGESEIVKNAHFYVAGFTHLSPQRGEILARLAVSAKSFTIGVQTNSEAEEWWHHVAFAI
jgi:ATP-dependent helicase/nuclease subunit B